MNQQTLFSNFFLQNGIYVLYKYTYSLPKEIKNIQQHANQYMYLECILDGLFCSVVLSQGNCGRLLVTGSADMRSQSSCTQHFDRHFSVSSSCPNDSSPIRPSTGLQPSIETVLHVRDLTQLLADVKVTAVLVTFRIFGKFRKIEMF